MRVGLILTLLMALLLPARAAAQAGGAAVAEPFKLGTFEIGGARKVGIVLRDQLVVDLAEANRALPNARPQIPADMIGVIAEYESGVRDRIHQIVNQLVRENRLTGGARPAYVHEVRSVRTLAPIPRPGKIMNTAVNFYSHINESGTPAEREAAIAARRANRGVPYMFLKASSSVIGNGDTILIPYGRDQLDWEVELATVIGKPARYVPATQAMDHVFGYTVMIDVSDRGGRPPGGFSSGTDWFLMKGQDTFGPMGPWIVPKEFYGDPMEKLNQTLDVGGQRMQSAGASDMIHSVGEVIEYASSLVTLEPGDIIGAGTSGGVGMGTSVRGSQVWLVPGDIITARIDGIGELVMPVEAAPQPPQGTGSFIPPVSSYRRGGQQGQPQGQQQRQ